MLDKGQIEKNINWLLSNGSAPVKYLTHKHLLRDNPDSRAMKQLWREVQNCCDAEEIFSKQKSDGSWCAGGSWAPSPPYEPKGGYSGFTPKYVTTAWILPLLGDMGFDYGDECVKKACEHALTFQRPDGRFGRFVEDQAVQKQRAENQSSEQANFPCELAVYLLGLGAVGMGEDARLKKSYELLVQWQRDDGGWVNQKHKEERNWSRSCPWVSHHAAVALFNSRLPQYKDALHKALKFLIWHLSQKEKEDIQRIYFHGHNMVKDLLMFSETGIGMKEHAVQVLLEWFSSMYVPKDGCFKYKENKPLRDRTRRDRPTVPELKYRKYHLIKDDWLTYYMTRIAANLLQHILEKC